MAEDLSIETVIIVGCICGFVVVFLMVVLVVLCLHRLRAIRQCEKFDKLNVHSSCVGMDSNSDLRSAEPAHSPARSGGIDNLGVDGRPGETICTDNNNRATVFATPSSAQLQVYNNGAVHLNYKPNSIQTKHHRPPPPPPPPHHNKQQQQQAQQQQSSALHDNLKNDNYEVNRLREHEPSQDKVLIHLVQSQDNPRSRNSTVSGSADCMPRSKKVIHEVIV